MPPSRDEEPSIILAPPPRDATRGQPVGRLVVVGGDAPRASYSLTHGTPLRIGRGASCQILRGSPDDAISENHAQITIHNSGACLIQDLQSLNGTWVNEQFVASTRALQPGDVIRVGSTTLRYESGQPSAVPVPVVSVAPVVPGGTRPPAGGRQATPAADEAAGTRAAWLQVVEGAEADKGRRIPISGGRTTLGRDPGSSIVLTEGSVSRQHAVIEISEGHITLTDTSTYKTTCVNGEKVEKAELKSGDRIRLGDITEVLFSWQAGQ